MADINFSFIIPHKDIPELLVRCLASIPRRPDVQIIVVDDNSDPAVVDFARFPGLDDPQVEVVLTKEGRGAGYARNVGLERAVGKWVVFADADDYYLDNLPAMMDRYVDAVEDMIIFRVLGIAPGEEEPQLTYAKQFDHYFSSGDIYWLKYRYFPPYGRFLRRNRIADIRFQEVTYANDVMFFLRFGLAITSIYVENIPVYAYCKRQGSLLTTRQWENYYTRTRVSLDALAYVKRVNAPGWEDSYFTKEWKDWWFRCWERNRLAALSLLPSIYWGTRKCPLFEMVRAKWGELRPAGNWGGGGSTSRLAAIGNLLMHWRR